MTIIKSRNKQISTKISLSIQGEDNQEKKNTKATRTDELISTRRRDECNNDRRSDINGEKIRGEEDHEEANRQGEAHRKSKQGEEKESGQ